MFGIVGSGKELLQLFDTKDPGSLLLPRARRQIEFHGCPAQGVDIEKVDGGRGDVTRTPSELSLGEQMMEIGANLWYLVPSSLRVSWMYRQIHLHKIICVLSRHQISRNRIIGVHRITVLDPTTKITQKPFISKLSIVRNNPFSSCFSFRTSN